MRAMKSTKRELVLQDRVGIR